MFIFCLKIRTETFNRTLEELKYIPAAPESGGGGSFNRTLEELK